MTAVRRSQHVVHISLGNWDETGRVCARVPTTIIIRHSFQLIADGEIPGAPLDHPCGPIFLLSPLFLQLL